MALKKHLKLRTRQTASLWRQCVVIRDVVLRGRTSPIFTPPFYSPISPFPRRLQQLLGEGRKTLWPSKVLPSFAGVFIAPVTEGWPGWVYLAWWLVSHLKYMCSESHVVGQIWYTCNCWNFSIFMPPKDLCLPHPQGGRRGTAGWYVWCDLILRLLTVTQTRVGPNLMFFTAVPACARQ